MYSTIFLLIVIAFFLFYNTSEKSKNEPKPKWAQRLASFPTRSKVLSIIILCACWVIVANMQGLVSGTFAFQIYVMAIGCLIVLLNPFKYINIRHIGFIFVLCLLVEEIIF